MTVTYTENLINVLNCTQDESANKVESMCQHVVQEAKVPEIASKDIKQPLLTLLPESTQGHVGLPDKVTVITSPSVHRNPIVHLIWEGVTPQVTEFTAKGITPLAANPNLLKFFAGRTSQFILNWKALTEDPWVIQTIEGGYTIPLVTTPVQQSRPHSPHSSIKETELLQEEIQHLLQKQAVQEAPPNSRGFFSNMFMVPKKDGGQRPVINLKQLNKFVKSEHFKMEGLHTVKVLIQQNDWMAKVDLKDAFFMVPIAQQHQHLLLFKTEMGTFHFKCLPFGLCTAPRVFTKVLKPAIELLRSVGIRLVIYMDDMLIMAHSKEMLREHVYQVLFLLENLGFIVNSKKSLLSPSQEIEFLGMIVNSQTMEIKLPGQKIKKIKQEARQILDHPRPSAQEVSQLLGKLNATSPALQMAPLFCRALQTCLKQALAPNPLNYQAIVKISHQAREDLEWWEQHLISWNGRSLISPPTTMTITSDASLQGWGAVCNGERTRGSWSHQEQSLHINCLKLLAATLGIQSFAKERSGISVVLKIDNTTAVAYINRRGGTISPRLSQLAKNLWLWCMERNILIQAQHVPGMMNSIADTESRAQPDRSDWKLSPVCFQKIHQIFVPLSVNLFATRLSAQLPMFISWKPDPLVMATDAFSMDWSNLPGKLYANPPWGLIGRVLSVVHSQKVWELILVAPVWKAQAWYPLLLQLLVTEPLIIPQSRDTIQSVCQNSLPDITPQLAVWAISGVGAIATTFRSQLQTSSYPPGETNQLGPMTHPLEGGLAGVMSGTKIPFLDLFAT